MHGLQNMEPSSPVTSGLKPILTVGQCFGLFPINSFSSPVPSRKRGWPLFLSRLLPILYSAYVLVANLTILGFAIVLFFRDIASPDANLVEQFLDMVYHSHILITISICIIQAKSNLPRNLASWERLEMLYQAFENEGPRDRVAIRKVFRPITTRSGNLPEFPIQILEESETEKHIGFAKMCKIVTTSYVLIIFIGAVSYFITISIKENKTALSDYLDEVSQIYVIPEACAWWTGFYVLFLGHTMELIWAYGDMLLLSASLVMGYQFKRFNKIVAKAFQKSSFSLRNGHIHPNDLEDLRLFHWEIAKVVKKTTRMLNHLTTTVFLCNILYLFSRVFNGIEEDLKHPSWFINFEAVYAFSYLIIRIFATAIVATKFATETTKSFRVLDRAGSEGEMEYLLTDRFCTQILTSNLAISGSGYFYLNRSFIATLVSALITYEVVILQFSVAGRSKRGMNVTFTTTPPQLTTELLTQNLTSSFFPAETTISTIM